MDETTERIAAQIDRTRERLGSNINELEQRVEAVTDWREQFRTRPYAFLAAAAVGGALTAAVFRSMSGSRRHSKAPGAASPGANGVASRRQRGYEVWDNVKAAAITLAGARLKEYVDQLLPGFEEHYQRPERVRADRFRG